MKQKQIGTVNFVQIYHIMSTAEIREEIRDYVDKADSRLLGMIYAMLKADEQNDLVGYTAKGDLLTKEEMIARAKKADQDIKDGRVKSLDELKKDIKNW